MTSFTRRNLKTFIIGGMELQVMEYMQRSAIMDVASCQLIFPMGISLYYLESLVAS